MGGADGTVAGGECVVLCGLAERAWDQSPPIRSENAIACPRAISSRWAPRVVREVGDLSRRAREAGKGLATLSVDTEVRFRSAAERAAFTSELTEAVTRLVSKYHDASTPGGRSHRLVLMAHPLPHSPRTKEQ